jgi:hypothetical protein
VASKEFADLISSAVEMGSVVGKLEKDKVKEGAICFL